MSESVFHQQIPLKDKPERIPLKDTTNLPNIHPWDKSIKSYYANKIKHAHNSIQNPVCPKSKDKSNIKQGRIKFTIIGNVKTKEFVYCAHMAQAMHRYRRNIFKPPDIKGITDVQWPSVWTELKVKYGGEAHCLLTQVAVLKNDRFFGGDEELKKYLEGHFIYHVCLDYHKEAIKYFTAQVKNSERPFAYMHISIDDKEVGTLIFMLYSDLVPNTCENFLRLCKTRRGGYSGTPVHRIVKDNWIQCGGFTLKSIDLGCENFVVPHDRRGVLAMCNDGRDIDCSTQFFVLLQPAMWMAYTYVAFGQLIDGEETLKKIEAVPTFYEAPTSAIIIHKAGVLNMDCRDIYINKGAQLFLNKHIEDLVSLGEWLMEILLQRVWAIVDAKAKKSKSISEIDLPKMPDKSRLDISRFNIVDDYGNIVDEYGNPVGKKKKRKKPKRIESSDSMTSSDSLSITLSTDEDDHVDDKLSSRSKSSSSSSKTYLDWDLEEEVESYSKEVALELIPKVTKPAKPFYLPLTDIPYPDEKDSCYDLKRLLSGDYCLESDMVPDWPKETKKRETKVIMYTTFLSEVLYNEEINDDDNEYDLDYEQEEEMENYVMNNLENMSYAGNIVRQIAKRAITNYIFENIRERVPTPPLTPLHSVAATGDDEKEKKREMRRRPTGFVNKQDLAHLDIDLDEEDEEARVVLKEPAGAKEQHREIRRRPTAFVSRQDLDHMDIDLEDEEEDDTKKVRVLPSDVSAQHKQIVRRPTVFVKKFDLPIDEDDDDEDDDDGDDDDAGGGGGGGEEDDDYNDNDEDEEEVEDDIVDLAEDSQPQTIKISEAANKLSARRKTGFSSELEKVKLIDRLKHSDSSDEEEEKEREEEEYKPPPPVLFFRPKEEDDAAKKPAMRIKALKNKIYTFGDEELRKLRLSGAIIVTKLTEDEKRKAKWAATLADFKSFQNIQGDAFIDEDEEEEEEEYVDEHGKVQLHISKKDKETEAHRQIKRRPTGFIRPEDLPKFVDLGDDDEDEDEEQEDEEEIMARKELQRQMKRRPTGFIRPQDLPIDNDDDDEDDDEDGQDKDQFREDQVEEESEKEEEAQPEAEPEPEPEPEPESEPVEEKVDFKVMGTRRQTEFSAKLEKIKLIEARKSYSDESTSDEEKKVHMSLPDDVKEYQRKIKRRPTGFFRPQDLPKLDELDEDDDEDEDKTSPFDVQQEEEEEKEKPDFSFEEVTTKEEKPGKQSFYLPSFDFDEPSLKDEAAGGEEVHVEEAKPSKDRNQMRTSVLTRLYESILDEEDEYNVRRAPTLRYSRGIPEKKNLLLTFAKRIKEEPEPKEKYQFRPSIDLDHHEFDRIGSVQYGSKVFKSMSTDHVTRINQLERLAENKASTASHTFAKPRAQLTVQEYQQQNREQRKYREEDRRLRAKLLEHRRSMAPKSPSAPASYSASMKENLKMKLPHSR